MIADCILPDDETIALLQRLQRSCTLSLPGPSSGATDAAVLSDAQGTNIFISVKAADNGPVNEFTGLELESATAYVLDSVGHKAFGSGEMGTSVSALLMYGWNLPCGKREGLYRVYDGNRQMVDMSASRFYVALVGLLFYRVEQAVAALVIGEGTRLVPWDSLSMGYSEDPNLIAEHIKRYDACAFERIDQYIHDASDWIEHRWFDADHGARRKILMVCSGDYAGEIHEMVETCPVWVQESRRVDDSIRLLEKQAKPDDRGLRSISLSFYPGPKEHVCSMMISRFVRYVRKHGQIEPLRQIECVDSSCSLDDANLLGSIGFRVTKNMSSSFVACRQV